MRVYLERFLCGNGSNERYRGRGDVENVVLAVVSVFIVVRLGEDRVNPLSKALAQRR